AALSSAMVEAAAASARAVFTASSAGCSFALGFAFGAGGSIRNGSRATAGGVRAAGGVEGLAANTASASSISTPAARQKAGNVRAAPWEAVGFSIQRSYGRTRPNRQSDAGSLRLIATALMELTKSVKGWKWPKTPQNANRRSTTLSSSAPGLLAF